MAKKKISEEEEEEPWYKGPLKIILSFFLIILIFGLVFPYYSIKINPEPKKILSLKDLNLSFKANFSVSHKVNSYEDFINFLDKDNAEIKYIADRVVSSACPYNKLCYAKALYYFVKENFNYIPDPTGVEYVKKPEETLANRGGDCDDLALLLASLLESVGIKTRFVFIPRHVYIQAYLPEAKTSLKDKEGFVSLDITCNYCNVGEVAYQNNKEKKIIVG